MNDLRVCTAGVGFAAVAALSTTALGQCPGNFVPGGDTAGTATLIPANTCVTGTTIGFFDDADEVCPYSGSTSPDVFYAVTEPGEYNVNISMCNSAYDTKVYVYDSILQLMPLRNGEGLSCNDDACTSSGGGAFRSQLDCVPPPSAAGGTIFIVVDGWSGDAGNYTLNVSKRDPVDCLPVICDKECPAGAPVEPDDCDFGNPAPNDTVNGGCNSTPNSFTPIACDTVVCGTGYFDGSFRDTDWWALDTTGDLNSTTFTMKGNAEFNSVYGRVENGGGSLDCSMVTSFAEVGVFEKCTPIEVVTARLDPGLYWFFVGPDFSEIVDCNQPLGGPPAEVGDEYLLEVNCAPNLPPCPWDLDGDNLVGFGDLLKVLSFWGPCPGLP